MDTSHDRLATPARPSEEREADVCASARSADPDGPRHQHRLLVKVRWGFVAFAAAHVLAYDMAPYPPGVLRLASAIVVVLALGNVLLGWRARRPMSPRTSARLSVSALVLDGLATSAFTYLYSFDPVSAIFTLLFLVPIEGALFFQLRGAMWSWAAISVLYTGREVFATQWGNPFEWTSLTFRVGMVGMVAIAVGVVTRQLELEHERSRRALADLQRVEQWRARVVAMLGHDLRSPLSAISGLAATTAVRAEQLETKQVRDLSERIVAQADGLLSLTTGLLDVARQEEGRLGLQREHVQVDRVVSDAAESAGHRDDTLIEVPADLEVCADPRRLGQALTNLITNAHRHGALPVEVTAEAAHDSILLRVRDHGRGVPRDLADGLFDPFVRGQHGGSVGLGLWIVRALVEAHDGEVTYHPAEPGSEFTVRLPAH